MLKKSLRLPSYSESETTEFIQMALSDDVPFRSIATHFGIKEQQIKEIMRVSISKKSYIRWRKRVKRLTKRRHCYK
jgi:uncharacterized protein (TIGR03643 family)